MSRTTRTRARRRAVCRWGAALVVVLALITGIAVAIPPEPVEAATPNHMVVAKNTDTGQFHLLARGETIPAPGEIDVRDIALPIAGILVDAYQGNYFKAVIALVDLAVDVWPLLEGGTKSVVERWSGYCRDVWETYAKVNIQTGFAGNNPHLGWESSARQETQYIRYLFETFLKRQPTCDELRASVGRMGGKLGFGHDKSVWKSSTGAWFQLNATVCEWKRSDGVPWAQVNEPNPAKRQILKNYCKLIYTPGVDYKMAAAFRTADAVAEGCDPTTVPNRKLLRHHIQFHDLAGDLEDLGGAIGRPGIFVDTFKYKTGRMVAPGTNIAVYNNYFTTQIPAGKTVDQWANELSTSAAVRDFVCPKAGPWIQEPLGGFPALVESDQVLRDFFDMNARTPFGTDVIDQAMDTLAGENVSVHMWDAVVDIAQPPNCDVVMKNNRFGLVDGGWACRPGDSGWATLNQFFVLLKNGGGGANPPPPTTTTTKPVTTTTKPAPGTIQGIKLIGKDGTTRHNPTVAAQSVYLDGTKVKFDADRAFRLNNVTPGKHTVSVSVPAGWSVGYTLCYNATTCHGTSPTAGSSVKVTVQSGKYADLWWHFAPPPVTIQGLKVLGSDGTTRSIPVLVAQKVYLDGAPVTFDPDHAYRLKNVPYGKHTVSVTAPWNYTVGYTLCYNSTTCHTATPTPGTSVEVNAPAGGYADLWWHYKKVQL